MGDCCAKIQETYIVRQNQLGKPEPQKLSKTARKLTPKVSKDELTHSIIIGDADQKQQLPIQPTFLNTKPNIQLQSQQSAIYSKLHKHKPQQLNVQSPSLAPTSRFFRLQFQDPSSSFFKGAPKFTVNSAISSINEEEINEIEIKVNPQIVMSK